MLNRCIIVKSRCRGICKSKKAVVEEKCRGRNYDYRPYGLIPVFTYCSYCTSCDIRSYILYQDMYDNAPIDWKEAWHGKGVYTALASYKPAWEDYVNSVAVVKCDYDDYVSDDIIGDHACWENYIIWIQGN